MADAGLIHRDVKPANLLIDRAGGVKLLDLGIVRIDGEATLAPAARRRSSAPSITSPPSRRWTARPWTPAPTCYALGATLYFLLAGHPPFPDGEPEEKVALKMSRDPAALDRLRPDVPPGLAAVVHRLLARNPRDRYATPSAAAAALQAWADAAPDFPARLFPPAEPAGRPEDASADDDSDAAGGSTPACATRRIVRSSRTVRVERARPSPPEEDGGIDFDAAPTDPVRIAGADLVAVGRRGVGRAAAVGGLVLLAALAAWAAGWFG